MDAARFSGVALTSGSAHLSAKLGACHRRGANPRASSFAGAGLRCRGWLVRFGVAYARWPAFAPCRAAHRSALPNILRQPDGGIRCVCQFDASRYQNSVSVTPGGALWGCVFLISLPMNLLRFSQAKNRASSISTFRPMRTTAKLSEAVAGDRAGGAEALRRLRRKISGCGSIAARMLGLRE